MLFVTIPMASNKDTAIVGVKYLTEEEAKLLPDPSDLDSLLKSSNITVHRLNEVVSNLSMVFGHEIANNPKYFRLIKGWFEHTLLVKENLPESISLLRLDGDLYSSTLVAMKNLYPLVSVGGWVVVDDYHLDGCRRAFDEYMEETNSKVELKFKVDEVPYFVKIS